MTRVELHDAKSSEDYNELHIAMGKEGFSRTITSSNGTVYDLPTAEYYLTGDYTLASVLEKAKKAADTIRKKYSAITSLTTGSTWHGLNITKK